MLVRLIAIDIDGTLLDSAGQLPERNRQVLHDAAEQGAEIVLATGRSFHHTREIAAQMPASTVLILNNGALVKERAGATLARHGLPARTARYILDQTRNAREGAAAIFDRDDHHQFVCERIDWTHPHRKRYYLLHRDWITETASLASEITDDPLQIGFTGGVDDMRTLARLLESLPRAAEYSHTLTEYPLRDFSLLDVLAPGRSKGRTLAEWAAHRDLTAGEVMAIGDNLNDREMLEFAGMPVVMGNAAPELRAFGWAETGTNDEGGLADAVAAYALGTRASPGRRDGRAAELKPRPTDERARS